MQKLKIKIRKQIDKIDREILKLLNKRAELAIKIGKLKQETGEEVYIPNREKEILLNLLKENKGPLPKESLQNIFSEILHAGRTLQSKLKIAYLGPEATFTHLAAVKNFGRYCEYVPLKTIKDVFQEVEKGRVDYGVVPIENSTEGVVNHTLDMFMESDLLICSELNLPIELCLLSKFSDIKKIKRLYSHPQALGQCRNWIEANLSEVEVVETTSTSKAAELAKKSNVPSAAIASSIAGEIYGLNIIAKGIEDISENYTRFLVIGKQSSERSGHDKTSIMFSIKDRVGALHDILVPFKKLNINLTKIESRPTRKKAWEYVFFLDFLGHIKDKKIKKALSEVSNQCVFLKVLGSYPRAE